MKLSDQKLAAIELCYDLYSDLPDGAWFAACEEHGITIEDWEAYSEMEKEKKCS